MITRLTTHYRPLILATALLIVFVGAALRFHDLGAQSLWNDEGSSSVQATRTLPQIAENAARDIHPPGYYALLGVWRLLAGTSEFGLRSLSALASVVTVALTYALGVRLFGTAAGLAAALLVALNTFSITYAQEARMYALLALWGAAATWAFLLWIESRSWRWAVVLALLNVAGLYTHYAYPAVMVAQGVLWLAWVGASIYHEPTVSRDIRRTVMGFVTLNLLTVALYLPWLPTALDQITTWPSTGDPIPINDALMTVVGWFTFGITYNEGGGTVVVAFFLLFGLLVFPYQRGERAWWRMLVPVAWVAVTLLGFLALGLFREANLKFLLPAQVGFALWMGRGAWVLWALHPRRTAFPFNVAPQLAAGVGMVALVGGFLTVIPPLYTDPAYQRDDYRGVVAAIMTDPRAGDAVILNAPGQQEVFDYYAPDGLTVYPLPIGMTVDVDATLTATRDIIADHPRIFAVLWGTDERDPQGVVEGTLDREAFEIDSTWYGSVRLARYVAPVDFDAIIPADAQFGDHITLTGYALSGDVLRPGDVLQLRLNWTTDTTLDSRYKVFVQLLTQDGVMLAQRDAEPGGGALPTVAWEPDTTITDNHALLIPADLPPGDYTLIVGLYNANDPSNRLAVGDGTFLNLTTITVQP